MHACMRIDKEGKGTWTCIHADSIQDGFYLILLQVYIGLKPISAVATVNEYQYHGTSDARTFGASGASGRPAWPHLLFSHVALATDLTQRSARDPICPPPWHPQKSTVDRRQRRAYQPAVATDTEAAPQRGKPRPIHPDVLVVAFPYQYLLFIYYSILYYWPDLWPVGRGVQLHEPRGPTTQACKCKRLVPVVPL
jgi:hypothetical protein